VLQAGERLTPGSVWQDHDLVFPSQTGTPLDPRNASRAFTAAAKRAGLEGVGLHSLRHTSASLMIAQGVHLRVIMETLGHSGISITADVYAHVLPQQQRQAADAVSEALRW
jgi:integrase